MDFLDRARDLLAQGTPVFPCHHDKRPCTQHGFKDATTEARQIAAWAAQWPDALVGVPTGKASGLFVLDVDVKGGKDGFRTLQEKGWSLPTTRTHRTKNGGGAHYLFRAPDGISLKTSAGNLGDGLDTRGDGGYIIWWPAHGCEVEHPDELADVPAWLVEALRAPRKPATTSDAKPFTEGARNDTLFRLAASLRAKGLTVDAIEAALLSENAAKCDPPLPDDEVRTIAQSAGRYSAGNDDEEIIRRLAAMTPLEYDRNRKDAAKRLGVRPATLDAMVTAMRKGDSDGGMDFPDVEPWPSPIDPAALLTEIAATLRRFIVCHPETADAVSLWVAMTWFMDAVQIAPLAVITAPEKRCGKSQMLALIGKLSYRPLAASNISPAALFRAVDVWRPTLLIDETDAFLRDNEELRGIINAGHTRDSAYVVRVVGEDFKPTRFSVWGAKALAGIGHLADTLMDRAILLELRRKLPHETVDRLRHAEPELFQGLAAKLARFAEDYRDEVRRARPELPDSLNDRAQDNWEPLLAIADVAGSDWPARGRRAALKLSGTDSPSMSTGTELLADIQEVFESLRVDRISTARLIEELCKDDERPWATYNRGKPITPRQVSKRLGEYGITSTTIRIGLDTPKGYRRDMFDEAFQRYLSYPPLPSATTPQPSNDAGSGVADIPGVAATEAESATVEPLQHESDACFGVADEPQRCGNETEAATRKPLWHKACGGVADTGGVSGSEKIEVEL
jgi:putative DNA primase/helicase